MPRGIPHSRFLAWDPDDQDKALAWMEAQRSRCPNCGTYPQEWIDQEGIPYFSPPYLPVAIRCIGCVTLEDEREHSKNEKGLMHFLRRNPEAWRNEWDDQRIPGSPHS